MKKFTNYSLKNLNTLKIDVSCDQFMSIENKGDLDDLCKIKEIQEGRRFVLGQGANVLFTGDFKGTVIQLEFKDISVIKDNPDDVILEVGAGAMWDDVVNFAILRNWGGIENMTLIPGTVGAAVVGNIAAYGQNFSDVCDGIVAFEFGSGKLLKFSKQDCDFQYRDSIFKRDLKDKILITSVFIKLSKNPSINSEYWSKKHGSVGELLEKHFVSPYTIANVADAVKMIRESKFPDMKQFGTAGSFFKNPLVTKAQLDRIRILLPDVQYYPAQGLQYVENIKDAGDEFVKVGAGDILDNGMGYKGLWIGNVGLYKNHALVLVTNGQATASEVVAFAQKIEKDFYDYCGIRLEREVITI